MTFPSPTDLMPDAMPDSLSDSLSDSPTDAPTDVMVDRPQRSLADHWQAVATVALLGVDRRPVPAIPPGPIGELVAARHHDDGAAMVIDLAAALTVARRAGVRPGPRRPALIPPSVDSRPVCPSGAIGRIAHLVSEWPELVDEWLTLVEHGGWRLPGDVTIALFLQFRGDPQRRAAIRALSGDLTEWLADLFPELIVRGPRNRPDRPEPVPIGRSTTLDPAVIVAGLESGELSVRHRTVLVHVVCSIEPRLLAPLAESLGRAGTNPNTMGLTLSLADLARTRHEMITELTT